jgi:hypothetical protein
MNTAMLISYEPCVCVNLCKFPVVTITSQTYLSNSRGTEGYTQISASGQQSNTTLSESHMNCSNFRRKFVDATKDRFIVNLLAINDALMSEMHSDSDHAAPIPNEEDSTLDEIITEKLFGFDENARKKYKDFVKEQAAILQMFRKAINVYHEEPGMNELQMQKTMFQRFMCIFISNLPEAQRSFIVVEANGITLDTKVKVNDSKLKDGKEIMAKGHSDVFICNPTEAEIESLTPIIDRIAFLAELKLPNRNLTCGQVYQARDQTLIETEMVSRMQSRRRRSTNEIKETPSLEAIVKSCYTDMHMISISIRIPQRMIPSDSIPTNRIFLVESRLVEAERYIKRLLLLLCQLNAPDILRLMNKSTFDSCEDVVDEEEDQPGNVITATDSMTLEDVSAAAPASSSSSTRSGHDHHTRSKAKFGDETKITESNIMSPCDLQYLDNIFDDDSDCDDENIDCNRKRNFCYFIPRNDNLSLNHETLQKLARVENASVCRGISFDSIQEERPQESFIQFL